MKKTHINKAKNPDGTRNVSFYSEREGWMPKGKLMPLVGEHGYYEPSDATRRWRKEREGK